MRYYIGGCFLLHENIDYYNLTAQIMEVRARGAQPLAHTHTYGCQGNVSDGERINGMLEKMGFGFTDDPEQADLILYNTCAVREHAQDRALGNVGALKNIKRRHPDTIIVLCGCMVQQEHVAEKIRKSFPFVNLVFGTHVIHRFPQLLYELLIGSKRVFELSKEDCSIHEEMPVRRDSAIKAWLPIMYGCENFCTYCVVPHVRGVERSRQVEDIEREFADIINGGGKDITLLGQNVNSYLRKEMGASQFPQLLRRLNETPGEYLIRFMTSHPKDCSRELIEAMRDCEHIAHHLHLPFQSGDNEILRRMNRKYTREHYLELIAMAREAMPDIEITSDVIVGFPGETREQFEHTLELVKQVRFTSLYTFIYSPRVGTPAAGYEDIVSQETKSAWLRELIELQESIAAERCAQMVGNTMRVLVEQEEKNFLSCRTSGNLIVQAKGSPDMVGRYADVRITDSGNWILRGEII